MQPSTSEIPKRAWTFGPLYDLMAATFPKCRSTQGLFDVPTFAAMNDVTHESAYKWFRKNKLPAERVRKICQLSKGKLRPEDLINFVV